MLNLLLLTLPATRAAAVPSILCYLQTVSRYHTHKFQGVGDESPQQLPFKEGMIKLRIDQPVC